jgi:hypothetical protein
MKKNLLLFVFVFATTFFTGNAGTNHYSSAEEENAAMFISYEWYLDPELTYPTGTYRDVNAEMDDLRETFPDKVFSAYYSPSLSHFEYGYRPGWPIKLIYSSLEE